MTEKQLNYFCEHYSIVFWFLYLIFPFFLQKFLPLPVYFILIAFILTIYFKAMYHFYQRFTLLKMFLLDSASIVTGLVILNVFVFFGSVASAATDLGIYFLASMFFMPTALRLEVHKKTIAF